MMPILHQPQILHHLAVPQNILVIVLVPSLVVMPVCHASTTHAVSVKIVLSSGSIVSCITLTWDLKLQKILMPCANQHTQNPVIPTQPLVAPPHHHVVNANLILRTMLTTPVVLSIVTLAAALAVAPHLIHPAMIVITMIAASADPLIHAMTTTLGTMISPLILRSHFSIATLESIVVLMTPLSYMAISWPNVSVSLMLQNLPVHPTTMTTILWCLEMSIILSGTQT